ncbi:hypothetical protein KY284_033717 [Solanum tuberosum]|nr:hypothetical protein KY284_033717 [Solanum tuberosum]
METDFTEMRDENRRRLCYGESTVAAASDRRRVRRREKDWRGKDEERSGGVQWPPSNIFSIFPQLSL